MHIIAGLGNPGAKYAHTRHNAGFDVLDILQQKMDIPIKKSKCHALVGEGVYAGGRVALLMPQTFMNLSGQSIQAALDWYKVAPGNLLVVVDDIDLPFGHVRIRPGGGPGTHNGLRSILQSTGLTNYPRIRVGVGAAPAGWDLADWVLSHYATEAERKTAFDAYMTAADAALCYVQKGIEAAMQAYNKKSPSPEAS